MRKNELREWTRVRLLEMARELDIPGRSGMVKDDLIDAIVTASSRRPAAGDPAGRGGRPRGGGAIC